MVNRIGDDLKIIFITFKGIVVDFRLLTDVR
jgi:hypothetical protein